jgi:hypothetical protein
MNLLHVRSSQPRLGAAGALFDGHVAARYIIWWLFRVETVRQDELRGASGQGRSRVDR